MGIKRDFQAEFDSYRQHFPDFFGNNRDDSLGNDLFCYVRLDGTLFGEVPIAENRHNEESVRRAAARLKAIEEYLNPDPWWNEVEEGMPWWNEVEDGQAPDGRTIERFGGHPGGVVPPREFPSGVVPPREFPSGVVPGKVTNAFYLNFHEYHRRWGSYIYLDGIKRKNRSLQRWFLKNKQPFPYQIIDWRFGLHYLIWHEYYHHRVESFATRLEVITGKAWYKSFEDSYAEVRLTDECYEEACANCNAREQTVEIYGSGRGRNFKTLLRKAIDEGVASTLPGYRMARNYGSDWESDARPVLFEDYLGNPPGIVPRPAEPDAYKAAWTLSNYLDSGICPHKPMVWYLLTPGTPVYNRIEDIGPAPRRFF